MYLSKILIENFRNFKKTEVEFNDGVNVIIGPNNSGKTNLIKALSLVINYQGSKRLSVDDFFKGIPIEELKAGPPKVSIAITIKQGQSNELDDLVTVGEWLTRLEEPYEALLTYEFFLPETQKDDYLNAIANASTPDSIWKIIDEDFIRLFTYRIWGGHTVNQASVDSESLKRFDFQFLSAIRDVERDMISGRNTLLREVLDFFMDYEIKALPEATKSKEDKITEIKNRRKEFSEKAGVLLTDLQERMKEGKKQILSYAQSTGALFDKAAPDFAGNVSEIEMFAALRLIVKHETGIDIPATHNGLGYNNLIFMSLLLAKMQVDSDGEYLQSNAKVFPCLAIEEPEAHLHPSMQYKVLKFLRENRTRKKVRQVFVTSHSTHITSAVSLDEILCLFTDHGETKVGYPGRVFPDEKSKKYVQRFLDATKSDMLFAPKVVLVEGLAEQLLLSILAKYLDLSLEDEHIAVINVGGRYFDHFLHLFDNPKPHTIPKKIACLVDRDPERRSLPGGRFRSCDPFEMNQDNSSFEYKENASRKIETFAMHSNVRFFSQDAVKGKTFEYDLVLLNPTLELLVTDSTRNKDELKDLMRLIKDSKETGELVDRVENEKIKQAIRDCRWSDENDKTSAIVATRYLDSIEKGENALDLVHALQDNLTKRGQEGYQQVSVPKYIEEALNWIRT